jgi:hypothetical protein
MSEILEIAKDDIKPIELNDFKLPILIQADSEYEWNLQGKLNEFLDCIKDRELIDENVYNRTEKNVLTILNAIEHYYDSDITKAKEGIYELLKTYVNNDFIVSSVEESPAFRGVTRYLPPIKSPYATIADAKLSFFRARLGVENFNRKDMLHIPFTNRGNVSTQRFSIAGVPCMYFGTTSYVCWLELGKPIDREFNISSYIVKKEIKILNLSISQMLLNGISNITAIDVTGMIELFPLIIATSFKIKENNRSFRSEYIVSQLIMQCLAELNIDGVAYTSKQVENDSDIFPYCINLAIPMRNNPGHIFSKFAKEIPLSKPINFAEYKNFIKSPYPQNNSAAFANVSDRKINYIGKLVRYEDLEFSALDNYLINEDHELYK